VLAVNVGTQTHARWLAVGTPSSSRCQPGQAGGASTLSTVPTAIGAISISILSHPLTAAPIPTKRRLDHLSPLWACLFSLSPLAQAAALDRCRCSTTTPRTPLPHPDLFCLYSSRLYISTFLVIVNVQYSSVCFLHSRYAKSLSIQHTSFPFRSHRETGHVLELDVASRLRAGVCTVAIVSIIQDKSTTRLQVPSSGPTDDGGLAADAAGHCPGT
jgi:hypothetical protein